MLGVCSLLCSIRDIDPANGRFAVSAPQAAISFVLLRTLHGLLHKVDTLMMDALDLPTHPDDTDLL